MKNDNKRGVVSQPPGESPSQSVGRPSPSSQNQYYERFLKDLPAGMKMLPFGPYAIGQRGEVYSFLKKRFLAQTLNRAGYLQVFLLVYGGKPRWFKVHRLVAMMFLRQADKKTEVWHKDGDKLNNYYKNLKRVTHSQVIGFSRGWSKLRKVKRGEKVVSVAARAKMSDMKRGERHPKFRGYYVYEGQRYASLQAVADAMGSYPMKVSRLVKSGVVGKLEGVNETV